MFVFPQFGTVDPNRAEVEYAPDTLEIVEAFCKEYLIPMPDPATQSVPEYARAVLNVIATLIRDSR